MPRIRIPSSVNVSGLSLLKSIAIASFAVSFIGAGVARADNDGIINTTNVPVVGHLMSCAQAAVAPPMNSGGSWTPSAFSFDISWVDPQLRAYFLADRSHNGVTPSNGGGGDVLVIDINSVSLSQGAVNAQIPDAGNNEGFYMTPPANDPMAGIRCDQNTAFGGTNGVGRNELTGPNGAFTVNHSEVWVGDGPSNGWQPLQFDTPGVLTNANPPAITSCASAGAKCTFPGKASDYAMDPCDSSVRVFDLVSRQQTDHIDVGGCFRTDEGAFDPVDQVALFANPSEQAGFQIGLNHVQQAAFVTLISTQPQATTGMNKHPIIKKIFFDGTNGTVVADQGIEQASWSPKTGMFYISIPGTSAHPSGYVVVIDPRQNLNNGNDQDNPQQQGPRVVAHVALHGGCAPNGSALGPDFELALFCSGGPIQVMDIRDGFIIQTVAGTTGGCDEGDFNAGDNHFVGACTDSNSPSTDNLDIIDADPVVFDQAINTNTAGAHSVAADPVTVSDWQPAAASTTAVNSPNIGGLCGPAVAPNPSNPCVLIYKSTGGDDPSEQQQEMAEDHGNNQ